MKEIQHGISGGKRVSSFSVTLASLKNNQVIAEFKLLKT